MLDPNVIYLKWYTLTGSEECLKQKVRRGASLCVNYRSYTLASWHDTECSLVDVAELWASKSVSEMAELSATLLNLTESKLIGELWKINGE